MTIRIRAIYIVVIVFPVLCTGVVWWIDIDTVHLLCIEIFQKLQRMVIIRFNQGMPKTTIRSVLHGIQRFKCRINRLTKLSHSHQLIQLEYFLLMCLPSVALHLIAVNLYDSIDIADVSGLQSDLGANTNRDVIERRAFRQMLFKHQTELLLLQ